MDLFEVIHRRQSVRAFSETSLDSAAVQKILGAARHAPSAGNLQAYEIYVVTRPTQRLALAEAAGDQMFISSAPTVLVFAAHPQRSAPRYGRRGEELYSIQDATIACTFAMLAATSLGIATVWVGAFDETGVRKVIDAPEFIRPVAILPMGIGAERPERRSRRPLDELVHCC